MLGWQSEGFNGDHQLVLVVQIESNPSKDNGFEMRTSLARHHRVNRTFGMFFKLLGQLIIDQLRLYLQMPHIIRIRKRRINGHMKSLKELMRLFRYLHGPFLYKFRVDGLFPLPERLMLLLR